jgi:hypothetical protein
LLAFVCVQDELFCGFPAFLKDKIQARWRCTEFPASVARRESDIERKGPSSANVPPPPLTGQPCRSEFAPPARSPPSHSAVNLLGPAFPEHFN